MDVPRFNVNGGNQFERITRTDSHQFARERRGPPQRFLLSSRPGPPQRLHTPTIIILSSVTHMNGPTFTSSEILPSLSAPDHTLFLFLIPLLVGVIEINNVKDEKKTLIETNPSMRLFLLALLIYVFAYFAAMKSNHQIFKAIAVISGSLCSVWLVSIILPHPYGHFSFIMWAFVLLLVAYNRRFHKKIWQLWNRFGENNQQLLPIYLDRLLGVEE